MDNAIVIVEKDGYKQENPLQCTDDNLESAEEDCLSRRLVNSEDVLLSSVKKSQISEFCIQKLFFQHVSCLNKRIPKQIMSVDDKYLCHCLELIHMSTLRANSLIIPSEVNLMSDSFSSRVISERISFGVENVVLTSTEDSILGSVTRSASMINILKSPLFRQLGALDNDDVSFGRTSPLNVRQPISSAVMSSPGWLCISSSQKVQQNERMVLEDQTSRSEPTSTNSTFSDQSNPSTSTAYCQGMLHTSWNGGFPHYVFSIDDQREVYTTHLSKVESPDDKVLDYMYIFHSRDGKKRNGKEKESDLVGKMRVSSSFTLCPHNTEIMETQFVLCATSDNSAEEMQASSHHTLRKQKGLSKKVVEIFRASQSYRHRTSSKFDGTSTIPESSLQLCQDSSDKSLLSDSEFNHPPNLELAAILVKNHIPENDHKEAEVGGWGLKFLKKAGKRQINVSCETCRQNTGGCSTSMDVLVPAGFHGGPRTKNGGPSSLIERWKSGGNCDCGGWDIGCPLTVLNTRPKPLNNNKDVLPQSDLLGESNTFDFFIQGSKQSAPLVKMVNIHDGLYYINYQSTISALQSLSIAVANIHSHSPTLRPKVYRN